MTESTRAPKNTIPMATMRRIDSDLYRIRHHPSDGPSLERFAYDHSNTLVIDSTGKKDLLIPNSVPLASDIARLLQHCSPAMIRELVRGYRIAKMAGILGDGKPPAEELQGFISPERAEGLYEATRTMLKHSSVDNV